jgi:hypothetical protein
VYVPSFNPLEAVPDTEEPDAPEGFDAPDESVPVVPPESDDDPVDPVAGALLVVEPVPTTASAVGIAAPVEVR